MLMRTTISHVALRCSSEQKADDFYKDILGLRRIKAFRLPRDLTGRIFGVDLECPVLLYGNDQCQVEVFLANPPGETGPRFEHLCVEVKDREAFMKTCQSANLEVNLVPKGDRFLLFVKDFDGNLFEIKEAEK